MTGNAREDARANIARLADEGSEAARRVLASLDKKHPHRS